jgi:Ran GTPase-activating protein (RanGAP) involved in mRNA processing and transport
MAARVEAALPPAGGGAGARATDALRIAAADIVYERTADGEKRRLGSGSFGTVYAATWGVEAVAVKQLDVGGGRLSDTDVTAFWAEVELMHQLHHKHVVVLYGAVVDEAAAPPLYALVMERAASSLHDLVHGGRGPPPLAERLRLLRQAAAALAFVHQRHIIHADLKPANILLGVDGGVRVANFGLAKLRRDGSRSRGSLRGARGKYTYMDPRLHDEDDGSLTKASDVYSFGVLAWEALTGVVPFSDFTTDFKLIRHVIGGGRPDVGALPAALRDSVGALLARCWHADPAQRPSAFEAAEALATTAASLAVAAATSTAAAESATAGARAVRGPATRGAGVAAAGCSPSVVAEEMCMERLPAGDGSIPHAPDREGEDDADASRTAADAAAVSRSLAQLRLLAHTLRERAIVNTLNWMNRSDGPPPTVEAIVTVCDELASLASASQSNRAAIVEGGAIPLVVDLLHWGHAAETATAWTALGSLVDGSALTEEAIAGACSTLFGERGGALVLFAHNARVCSAVVATLSRIRVHQLTLRKLGPQGARALAGALSHVSQLTTLDLNDNPIGAEGASALAGALAHVPQLATLALRNIGAEGASALAGALAHVPRLTTLELSRNSIRDHGACALAGALVHVPRLTTLELGRNSIHEHGACALAGALVHVPRLTTLELWWNSIGDEGARALAGALAHVPHLMRLNLAMTSIGDEGARALADALEYVPQLTTLHLCHNCIGDEGARALAGTIAHVPQLTALSLEENRIGDDGKEALTHVGAPLYVEHPDEYEQLDEYE